MKQSFDSELDDIFEARLARIPVPPRAGPRQRRARGRMGAIIAALVLVAAASGTVFAANASAESQGASCADLITRFKLLTGIAHVTYAEPSAADLAARAAKIAAGNQLAQASPKGQLATNGSPITAANGSPITQTTCVMEGEAVTVYTSGDGVKIAPAK